MSFECKLEHGDPLKVDYTPSGAVSAGQVVVLGELPLIAALDIAANRPGALNMGNAGYTVAKIPATVIGAGVKLYWDDTNNYVTPTAGVLKIWGYAGPAGAASADTQMYAIHKPGG